MIINSSTFPVLNFSGTINKKENKAGKKACQNKVLGDSTLTSPMAEQIRSEVELDIKADRLFKAFISKGGRIKKEEYEALEDKKLISKKARAKIEEEPEIYRHFMPETAAKYTMAMKDYFDLRYPEGYRIVSVGTSPDSISTGLEFLGCDVVYIPVTSLRHISKSECRGGVVQNIEKFPNLGKVLKYVESKGITQEKTQNDPRKIIVLDVSHKGKTLNRFAKLLEAQFGISPEKIEKVDFSKTLGDLKCSQNEEERKLFDKYGITPHNLMLYDIGENEGYIAKISNTPHFNVYSDDSNKVPNSVIALDKSDEEIFAEFEQHSNPLARAHNFLMMEELEKLQH